MVSVIIPTYNEASVIEETLERLRRARGNFEVIVVDGASTDATRARVKALVPRYSHPLRLLDAPRNRAVQLSQAAARAHGETLLFLHADVLVPVNAIEILERALAESSVIGGNFDVVFSGDSGWSRFFTWANRLRRRFGIYYGDSGLFVRRGVFDGLGGFKPIPIMDDYEFVRRMERAGRTICLPAQLIVSDRRWREQGVIPTLLSWIWVQALFSADVRAAYLARWYAPVRAGKQAPPGRHLETSAVTSESVSPTHIPE